MKKLKEFPQNESNPFVQQALMRIGQTISSKKVVGANKDEAAILKGVSPSTGEILGSTVFMRAKTVDSDQFAKFYLAGFKAFFELRPATIKVFGYILKLLKVNSDEFIFLIDKAKEATGYGRTTIYHALTELCNAEIIARGAFEEQYFINPMVVFNGDRVTFATTYINKNYPQHQTTSSRLKGTIAQLEEDGTLKKQDMPSLPFMDENAPATYMTGEMTAEELRDKIENDPEFLNSIVHKIIKPNNG